MSSTRTERGFTLIEMLVAASLVLMFLGLLYGMFLPVMSVASAGSAKTDTLTVASTALQEMEGDIRVSTTRGISIGSTPATPPPTLGTETQVMAFEVPEKFVNVNDRYGQFLYEPNTGLSGFETYVVWSLVPQTAGGNCSSGDPCDLYRTTYDTTTMSTSAILIDSGTLSNITANIATNGQLMARNITSFQMANHTICPSPCIYPTALPEVEIEMAVQSQDQSGRWSQSSFETQVFDRNN